MGKFSGRLANSMAILAGGTTSQRLASVARKEFLHIIRDPMTLFFTLFIPIIELFMLGYAIDTNVRHVRTVVFDQADTQESRALLRQFENSEDFSIKQRVFTDEALRAAIVGGQARVGIKIPEDYSRRIQAGMTGQVLILVDGSESSVAAEAVNVGNAIALKESLALILGQKPLPVEPRPQVLFNPDTRSANFFIPGLMVVMCQMMAVMLSATSIVREKENGTLEQLFMTPVRGGELILGKLLPYLILTFVEFCSIALLMRTGDAFYFFVRLCLSSRFHARSLLLSRPGDSDDVDDRRGARRHTPRRWLGRIKDAFVGPLEHGAVHFDLQHLEVPQAPQLGNHLQLSLPWLRFRISRG
jgi:ABC-type Na+ efflux pump permease subunit